MPVASQPAPSPARPARRPRRPATASADRRRGRVLRALLPRLAGNAAVVGLWQFASGRLVPAFVLPSPLTILRESVAIVASGAFWTHFGATVRTIAIGYALAFVIGFAVGIVMGRPLADALIRDWVVSLLNTPGLVFVLVATMIFGFHPLGPITAIVLTSFPFVTINIAEGINAVPRDLIDMSRAFDVTPGRRLRQVIIPALAPYTFAGLRYGFSIAWKIATLAELFGASAGIGFMIRREFGLFSMTGMLAWIALFCAFALLLETLLARSMRRYFRWRPAVAMH